MTEVSTTQLGLQRLWDVEDTYVPGTVVERLYKRAQKAHDESDNYDGVFVLTADVIAPTAEEVATVRGEIGDEALTRAIETVKQTVRPMRHRVDSRKVKDNKAQKALAEEYEN